MAKSSKTAKKTEAAKDKDAHLVVARNRRARFEFELLEVAEAGLVLTGTEVKSLRNGKSSLEESYVDIEGNEAWLIGCDIPEYLQANRMNHKPKRKRKLLLHRREIDRIGARISERGLTIIPLQIYFKNGVAKVEISLARGRKLHDKRQALKSKDAKRDIDRAVRGRD